MKWPMVKLGELICEERSGASLKKDQFEDSGYAVIPKKAISESVDLRTDTFVFTNEAVFESCKSAHVNKDFLLTTLRNLNPDGSTLGLVCRNDYTNEMMLAQGMYAFKVNEKVDSNYLCYATRTPKFSEHIQRIKVGSTQVHIRAKELKDIEIPLPPLGEQKRIAAILDKADATRRKRQQAIDLADEFLRSVFLDMFGDPVTNPKGWEVKPVGDICGCIVPGRDKPKSFTGTTPWITTNELIHLGVTTKKDEFIGLSEQEINQVKARVVPAGSVLMTCVGDLGVVSIAGEDMVINQQLHAFLPSDYATPSFLSYTLAWQKGYMVRMASSTTVPYMNKTICNSVPVIMPPKHLQESFDKIVRFIKCMVTMQKNLKEADLFASLSKQAFSGELFKRGG